MNLSSMPHSSSPPRLALARSSNHRTDGAGATDSAMTTTDAKATASVAANARTQQAYNCHLTMQAHPSIHRFTRHPARRGCLLIITTHERARPHRLIRNSRSAETVLSSGRGDLFRWDTIEFGNKSLGGLECRMGGPEASRVGCLITVEVAVSMPPFRKQVCSSFCAISYSRYY